MVIFGVVVGLLIRAMTLHGHARQAARRQAASQRAAYAAATIVARSLAGAVPQDLIQAASSDSALEFMAPVGAGQGCVAGHSVVSAASTPDMGPAFASFVSVPQSGDRVFLFDDRDPVVHWRTSTVAAVVASAAVACTLAGVPPNPPLTVLLDSVPTSAPVAAFVISRRTRFSLYRSGDGGWYLGMREWNPAANRFDGVQPVAGPLLPNRRDPGRSGLQFTYRDAGGAVLRLPGDSIPVASVEVTARGADSAHFVSRVVALRRGS